MFQHGPVEWCQSFKRKRNTTSSKAGVLLLSMCDKHISCRNSLEREHSSYSLSTHDRTNWKLRLQRMGIWNDVLPMHDQLFGSFRPSCGKKTEINQHFLHQSTSIGRETSESLPTLPEANQYLRRNKCRLPNHKFCKQVRRKASNTQVKRNEWSLLSLLTLPPEM